MAARPWYDDGTRDERARSAWHLTASAALQFLDIDDNAMGLLSALAFSASCIVCACTWDELGSSEWIRMVRGAQPAKRGRGSRASRNSVRLRCACAQRRLDSFSS